MKRNVLKLLIVVLCVFAFTGCNKEQKVNFEEGKDYFIRGDFSGAYFNLAKRGYYIDTYNQTDNSYFYIICMGEKNTGGYSLKIKDVKKDDNHTEVIVEELVPGKDAIVTMAFTYPTIVIEFTESQDNIVIKNTEGIEFDKLN